MLLSGQLAAAVAVALADEIDVDVLDSGILLDDVREAEVVPRLPDAETAVEGDAVLGLDTVASLAPQIPPLLTAGPRDDLR